MPGPEPYRERMAAIPNKDHRLIWIDLEMTGLDTDNDSILEIATVVTDADLNVLADPELAIAHPVERLEAMDEWNRNQHRKSGLWQRSLEHGVSMAEAEERTLAFLAQWVPANTSPICGNSICQDRRFLHREMPRLERYFHCAALGTCRARGRRQGRQTHRTQRHPRFDRRTQALPRRDGPPGRGAAVGGLTVPVVRARRGAVVHPQQGAAVNGPTRAPTG
jgi:oligoribonuclease